MKDIKKLCKIFIFFIIFVNTILISKLHANSKNAFSKPLSITFSLLKLSSKGSEIYRSVILK